MHSLKILSGQINPDLCLGSPQARVIVLLEKSERQCVDKLNEILPLYTELKHPVSSQQMAAAVESN